MEGCTAAAISQRIRALENELGLQLLNRSAHAASPTTACLRLLPRAKAILEDVEQLTAPAFPDELVGVFRLGAISTALTDYVPAIVRKFRETAPKVSLHIRPGTSQSLYDDLIEARIDAAITVSPPFMLPKSVRSLPIAKQPFVQIFPRSAETDTGSLPWILYDRKSWGGRLVWPEIEDAVSRAQVICELDAVESIALMVEEGVGQAVLPRWAGLKRLEPSLLVKPLTSRSDGARPLTILAPAVSDLSSQIDILADAVIATKD
ncbi:hypothetical protein GCM10009077_15000 [Roseibium denhamense]